MSSKFDAEMNALLKTLMEELEKVGEKHEELYDSEVRESMYAAIFEGFLKPQQDFVFPDDFGMSTPQANQSVRNAIERYISLANKRAKEIALNKPNDRLAAFQNGDICTNDEQQYPDDFFGWSDSIE